MAVNITKPVQGGKIRAISSKSEAHRLLICAALADRETFVACPDRSEDIDATVNCLQSIGAAARYDHDGFFIAPIRQDTEKTTRYVLDCGESGSTLRFLLPVCAALGLEVDFNMSGRLPQRPLSALYDEMVSHGCKLSGQGSSPLTCEGLLEGGPYDLPGNISSQYVSGLLFALPLLQADSTVRVSGVLESRPYVDMTLDTLSVFGIEIFEEEINTFKVSGGQVFRSPGKVQAGGDWSNAAFWLAAGAIGKSGITCTNLDFKSRQGDRLIVELLMRFGARVTCDNNSVTVSPGTLFGIEINAEDTPDLVPVLAAVASVAEGKTVITGAGRLRIKESDRLRTVTSSLAALGADITETEDGLIINGRKRLTGGETDSFGDHRIAMAAAVVSSACDGTVTIRRPEAVRKSYPGFFEDFSSELGGEWEEC